MGRSKKAWSSYPASWVKTETIANELLSNVLGQNVDAATGDLIITRKAVELMLEKSIEENAGACAEWPLLATASGFQVGCELVDGLSWEDPDRFQHEIITYGGFEKWKKTKYGSLDEWIKRSQYQLEILQTIARMRTISG